MLEDKIKGKNKNMQAVANYLMDKAKKDPGYSKMLEETERVFRLRKIHIRGSTKAGSEWMRYG